MTGKRAFHRSPLLLFAILGGLLFTADALRRGADEDPKQLFVDDAVRAALAESFELRERRPPTDDELAGEVHAWVREEVLVREAIRTGLHHADPVVRRRLVQAMEYLLEDSSIDDPDDETLRAWFDERADGFERPGATGFLHVFTAGSDEAARDRSAELRVALDAGAPAAGLGDPFPDGPRIGPATRAQLDAVFGDRFVTSLDACEPRIWCGPIASELGWHVVRIDERRQTMRPAFEDVRHEVRDAWIIEETRRRRDAAIQQLVSDYEVQR